MKFIKSAAAIVLLSLFSLQASAAVIYGDDIKFTYDDSTLFGEATVFGNNIFFLTTNFKAESLNGEGLVETLETLDIQMEVTTVDRVMTQFLLAESGDYLLNGAGASVSVGGTFSIDSNNFAYSDSVAFDAGPLTVNTGALTAWDIDTGINLDDTAGWSVDDDVTMTLSNLATATTLNEGVGEQAFIEKKLEAIGVQVMIGSVPDVVPVPAAVWLFGSGLAALGLVRRKRAKL